MARRGRRRGAPRCNTCSRPVVLLMLRSGWRTFEPRPVDGRTHIGAQAHPVEGKFAWPSMRELVEDLMVRRECGRDEAQDEAYDMPFYVRHACPVGAQAADTTTEPEEETS